MPAPLLRIVSSALVSATHVLLKILLVSVFLGTDRTDVVLLNVVLRRHVTAQVAMAPELPAADVAPVVIVPHRICVAWLNASVAVRRRQSKWKGRFLQSTKARVYSVSSLLWIKPDKSLHPRKALC